MLCWSLGKQVGTGNVGDALLHTGVGGVAEWLER